MTGVRVNNREELERYLREHPIQLRAGRPPRGPRPGSPEFIGPVSPAFLKRQGAIATDPDGEPSFTLRKEPWEREHVLRLLRLLGERE